MRDGGDPLIADTTSLSTFPGYPTTPTTPGGSQPIELQRFVQTVPGLEPGVPQHASFFLRASTLGSRVVAVQLRYSVVVDGESCVCSSFSLVEVELSPVFQFSSCVLNGQLEEAKAVGAGQGFMIMPKLVCLSPHTLLVTESRYRQNLNGSRSNTILTIFVKYVK